MAFPQASDYRPPIIPDGQEYDNPENGKSYYWTQILLPEGSTVDTATTIGGYWTVVCDEEAKFLLRRGDDVDDCTQPVTYSWNEDVSLLAQNNLTLSSNQGDLTTNAQDRVYISSTLGGAIEANNNQLLSWDALDVKLTKTILNIDNSKVVVNKEYVDNRDQILQEQIIELEEEIDAIAPSVQRGNWEVDQSVTQGDASVGLGKFYLVKTAGAGFDVTTNYAEADGIVLSNTDLENDTHTWVDVEDEQLIQMFDKSDSDFVLGEITNTTPTYSGNNNVLIEFNRIQSQGSPVNSPDTQGRYLARLNIFEAPSGGDASGFVLKSGDTMTGNLAIDKSDASTNIEAGLELKGSRGNTTNSAATITFDNKQSLEKGYLTYRSYGASSYFRFNQDVDLNNKGLHSVAQIRLKPGGYIGSGSSPRLTFNDASSSSDGDGLLVVPRPSTNRRGFVIRGNDALGVEKDILYTYTNPFGTPDAINYLGKMDSGYNLVNKEYVDSKAGGVDISCETTGRSKGDMWYCSTDQVLYIKVS